MAAGDQVVIGSVVKIGFGNFELYGEVAQSVTHSLTADVATAKDQRGANISHVISNPAKVLTISTLIPTAETNTPPSVGDIIELTRPDDNAARGYVLATPATIAHTPDFSTLTLTVMREDNVAAMYDAFAAVAFPGILSLEYSLSSPADINVAMTGLSAAAAFNPMPIKSIVVTYIGNVSVEAEVGDYLVPGTDYIISGNNIVLETAWLNTALGSANQGSTVELTIMLIGGNGATVEILVV